MPSALRVVLVELMTLARSPGSSPFRSTTRMVGVQGNLLLRHLRVDRLQDKPNCYAASAIDPVGDVATDGRERLARLERERYEDCAHPNFVDGVVLYSGGGACGDPPMSSSKDMGDRY